MNKKILSFLMMISSVSFMFAGEGDSRRVEDNPFEGTGVPEFVNPGNRVSEAVAQAPVVAMAVTADQTTERTQHDRLGQRAVRFLCSLMASNPESRVRPLEVPRHFSFAERLWPFTSGEEESRNAAAAPTDGVVDDALFLTPFGEYLVIKTTDEISAEKNLLERIQTLLAELTGQRAVGVGAQGSFEETLKILQAQVEDALEAKRVQTAVEDVFDADFDELLAILDEGYDHEDTTRQKRLVALKSALQELIELKSEIVDMEQPFIEANMREHFVAGARVESPVENGVDYDALLQQQDEIIASLKSELRAATKSLDYCETTNRELCNEIDLLKGKSRKSKHGDLSAVAEYVDEPVGNEVLYQEATQRLSKEKEALREEKEALLRQIDEERASFENTMKELQSTNAQLKTKFAQSETVKNKEIAFLKKQIATFTKDVEYAEGIVAGQASKSREWLDDRQALKDTITKLKQEVEKLRNDVTFFDLENQRLRRSTELQSDVRK